MTPTKRHATLIDRGFAATVNARRPRCSQCEVLVINNTPCHETGCPNARHECRGCDALIPVRQKYCEDCQ